MSHKCRIWYDTDVSAYRFSCSYSRNFIEAIKALIPASDRAYDDQTKIWLFSERYYNAVADLAKKVYGTSYVSIMTRQQAEANTQKGIARGINGKIEDTFVAFVKLLPFNAAAKAYRQAAVELHPDKAGGSMENMARLNEVWGRIKREHYKQ